VHQWAGTAQQWPPGNPAQASSAFGEDFNDLIFFRVKFVDLNFFIVFAAGLFSRVNYFNPILRKCGCNFCLQILIDFMIAVPHVN
jgi:hypothetical protein